MLFFFLFWLLDICKCFKYFGFDDKLFLEVLAEYGQGKLEEHFKTCCYDKMPKSIFFICKPQSVEMEREKERAFMT